MHLAGLKLCIVPNAIIYHDRPQDGIMGENFYNNLTYTKALLNAKNPIRAKKHFIWRKIITDYIAYIIAYLGKNKQLKNSIISDIKYLKLIKKVNNNKLQKL